MAAAGRPWPRHPKSRADPPREKPDEDGRNPNTRGPKLAFLCMYLCVSEIYNADLHRADANFRDKDIYFLCRRVKRGVPILAFLVINEA